MRYKLIYSKEASRDLRAIYQYITYELKNSQAAKRTVKSIVEVIESLNEFPERGGRLLKFVQKNYRFVLANNYIIIYRVQDSTVHILRILYKRRDIVNLVIGNRE